MLLTIKEVAMRLQIKPSTLYAWAAQGRIPCLRIHGLVRFRQEEIDHWVESFRAEEPPATLISHPKGERTALDNLIARAKGQVYNSASRGNQAQSSPIGKEKTDGAV